MILPSEGVARDWLNRSSPSPSWSKGDCRGPPPAASSREASWQPPLWPAFQPLQLFGDLLVFHLDGEPLRAVFQASDHRLAAWLQRPVNPKVSAACGREPSRGPGTLASSVSMCWPPPGGCSAHPPVLEEDQGVPHPLEPVSGTPAGQRGVSESLCRKRRPQQVSPPGGVSGNLRQPTGPICARRLPGPPSSSHTWQGRPWLQRATGRHASNGVAPQAPGMRRCVPRVQGPWTRRGAARLLAFICRGGVPRRPACSAGGCWAGAWQSVRPAGCVIDGIITRLPQWTSGSLR